MTRLLVVPDDKRVEATSYAGRIFLTVADVARITETDPRTVRRGIELGSIPAVHVSENTIRVPAAPFWRLCGLDPQTLEPERAAGLDNNEAGPATGPTSTTTTPAEELRRDHDEPRPQEAATLRSAAP